MKEYSKIQTVYKRDMANKGRTLLEGQFSLPEFEYLQNNIWEWTEKVDGTNIRIQYADGQVVFQGKSQNSQIPAQLVQRLREVFDPLIPQLSEIFPDGGCLYGEGCGPKIQKGGENYGAHPDFILFDVLVGGWWLSRPNVQDVADKLGLRVVPVIGEGTLGEMVERARRGFSSIWGDFQAEGIVARPQVELQTRGGERILTKIKTRDFPKGVE